MHGNWRNSSENVSIGEEEILKQAIHLLSRVKPEWWLKQKFYLLLPHSPLQLESARGIPRTWTANRWLFFILWRKLILCSIFNGEYLSTRSSSRTVLLWVNVEIHKVQNPRPSGQESLSWNYCLSAYAYPLNKTGEWMNEWSKILMLSREYSLAMLTNAKYRYEEHK